MRPPLVTALTVLILIDGLGWGIGVLPTLKYMLDHRALPTFAGIRLLSGPFEALGIDAMIAAGLSFVMIGGLKLLAAHWVWNLRMDGAILELILLGISIPFWYGFALPFGPIIGLAEVVLLALTWKMFT